MEIILAIVVASAVIFFGALISMGNERQRKAIDKLREQIVLWAMQDLRLKREIFSRDVRVDDPLDWLNKIVANIWGHGLNLQVIQVFDEPRALLCEAMDGSHKVIFSLVSPNALQKTRQGKRSRLSQSLDKDPYALLVEGTSSYEISSLTNSAFFDLELAIAWAKLTGQDTGPVGRLWMNVIKCD